MIIFPKSRIDQFVHTNQDLRWGQQFYQHMELHKCTNPEDAVFLDRLYNADDETAKAMVRDYTDYNN